MSNIKSMGVINITPDSFSDGNESNTFETFQVKFEELSQWADIIDIGAESTAPFNNKVTADEEKKRFDTTLIAYAQKVKDPKKTISIDTYKIEVFEYVATKITKVWPESRLIFNDVSGCLDAKLISFLKESPLEFSYVYSHNLVPTRTETTNHMNYTLPIDGIEFVKEIVEYFVDGIHKLKSTNRQFFVDPCFGFSKTKEQNHTLIKFFKTFLMQMPYDMTILFGISRKSFLRLEENMNPKEEEVRIRLDHIQTSLILDILKDGPGRDIVFRVHDKNVIKSVQDSLSILS